MRRLLTTSFLALSLAACAGHQPPVASVQQPAAPAAAPAPAQPAPLGELVRAVDIPYERFQLDNGLTVLVHTDRKAPIVGVTLCSRA